MLPQEFYQRMEGLLGEQFPAFLRELETEDSVHAFRVNPLKISPEEFCKLLSESPKPLPFFAAGFYSPWEKPGNTVYHHAGMIYMQDPSAMATALALPIGSDWKILDACAAPGGKSGQLCAFAPDGVVVSNEYVPARARILQGNLERLGAKNAVVTNLDTCHFASIYPDFFDLVVADAPCSGEGMFRKNELAISEWSLANVSLCAQRQMEILCNLAPCVKGGGSLLYSTCTFSQEENEQVICRFLQEHEEFSLVPVAEILQQHTAPGILQSGYDYDLTLARRFYPHLTPGEGQFIALLRRDKSADAPVREKKDKSKRKAPASALQQVVGQELQEVRSALGKILTTLPDSPIYKSKEDYFLCPDIPLPAFGVVCGGVCIGTMQKGVLRPHHQLFSAYGKACRVQIHLPLEDPRLEQYLRGEEIEAEESGSGFCAVLAGGVPLGGGKLVGGRIKNHYPKGLRKL